MKLQKYVDGYLTVYLTLIMTVLLSLFLALVEGAKRNALEFEAECVTDIAMNSIMAEYNRALFLRYHIFAIDNSYLTEYASKTNTEQHLKEYLKRNASNETVFLSAYLYRDFLGLHLEDAEITKVAILSDQNGELFRQEAIAAIKDDSGLALLSDVTGWMEEVHRDHLEESSLEQEKDRLDEEIERKLQEAQTKKKLKEPNEESGEAEGGEMTEIQEFESPTGWLDGRRREGILKSTVADTEKLSDKLLDDSNLIMARMKSGNISTGNMMQEEKGGLEEMSERFLFREYLMHYMGNFLSAKEDGALSYQVEYIIAGQHSDVDNLRSIAGRICLMREAANSLYLFSDQVKCEEAELLATALSLMVAAPEIKDLLKISILLGWAYAESLYDVKVLLDGGKVPLKKTEETWHYSLANAFKMQGDEKTSDGGLTYQDYLRILLMLSGEEEVTLRAMNMVEADMRQMPQNSYFRMDACYTAIEATAHFVSNTEKVYKLTKQKKYE